MIANVYIQIDSKNRITAVGSDLFLEDVSTWILIDSGEGDRYTHADSMYLELGLCDETGRYNYKYENDEVLMRTEEEKSADVIQPVVTEQDQINATLTLEIAKLKMEVESNV